MSFSFDARKPIGSRVEEIKVGGKPIEMSKLYRVATNDYLVTGGDGYKALTKGKVLIGTRSGTLLTDVLTKYIKAHDPIAKKAEGRIVEIKP